MYAIKDVSKTFSLKEKTIQALSHVSLEIHKGEVLGIVGESGCGKSTLGRCILGLEKPTSGEILFHGKNLAQMNPAEKKEFRKKAQIIFQDPYASLNPRMTTYDIIKEPLEIHGFLDKEKRVLELLSLVGLDPSCSNRFPHEFSGGQRQRIGIARALALSPEFIVCDEPISALDVSIQAQIINLLKTLQKQLSLTLLFIAHDLSVVRYISDRVAVMYLGHILEVTSADELYQNPLHPYTQALLAAIPGEIQEEKRPPKYLLPLEAHTPPSVSQGCPFYHRCPKAMDHCKTNVPPLKALTEGHQVACHLYDDEIQK